MLFIGFSQIRTSKGSKAGSKVLQLSWKVTQQKQADRTGEVLLLGPEMERVALSLACQAKWPGQGEPLPHTGSYRLMVPSEGSQGTVAIS